MVAGMAMASLATRALHNCGADSLPFCGTKPQVVVECTQGNLGAGRFIGFHLMFYTPLHTPCLREATKLYGMFIWGVYPHRWAA